MRTVRMRESAHEHKRAPSDSRPAEANSDSDETSSEGSSDEDLPMEASARIVRG